MFVLAKGMLYILKDSLLAMQTFWTVKRHTALSIFLQNYTISNQKVCKSFKTVLLAKAFSLSIISQIIINRVISYWKRLVKTVYDIKSDTMLVLQNIIEQTSKDKSIMRSDGSLVESRSSFYLREENIKQTPPIERSKGNIWYKWLVTVKVLCLLALNDLFY